MPTEEWDAGKTAEEAARHAATVGEWWQEDVHAFCQAVLNAMLEEARGGVAKQGQAPKGADEREQQMAQRWLHGETWPGDVVSSLEVVCMGAGVDIAALRDKLIQGGILPGNLPVVQERASLRAWCASCQKELPELTGKKLSRARRGLPVRCNATCYHERRRGLPRFKI